MTFVFYFNIRTTREGKSIAVIENELLNYSINNATYNAIVLKVFFNSVFEFCDGI